MDMPGNVIVTDQTMDGSVVVDSEKVEGPVELKRFHRPPSRLSRERIDSYGI